MGKSTKYHDDLLMATALAFSYDSLPDWMKMNKPKEVPKKETPDQRLKKLLEKDEITVEQYSKWFMRCTHADVDGLERKKLLDLPAPVKLADIPTRRSVMQLVESEVYQAGCMVFKKQDMVLVLGRRSAYELGRDMDRMGTVRVDHHVRDRSMMYKGYRVVEHPDPNVIDYVKIMPLESYNREVVHANARRVMTNSFGNPDPFFVPMLDRKERYFK